MFKLFFGPRSVSAVVAGFEKVIGELMEIAAEAELEIAENNIAIDELSAENELLAVEVVRASRVAEKLKNLFN